MTHLLTVAQMQAVEAAALRDGVLQDTLMQAAGAGVVAAVMAHWPVLAAQTSGGQPPHPRDISARKMGRRAVVVCGPGHNGADGFVVARLLHAAGWQVDVVAPDDSSSPAVRAQAAIWRDLGPVHPVSVGVMAALPLADLYVDAVFGTGLARPLSGIWRDVVDWLARLDGVRLVAVDMPSGLSADTGLPAGPVPHAGLTVTFDSAKLGHYLADGPQYCGQLVVADIGIGQYHDVLVPDEVVGLVDVLPQAVVAACDKVRGHKYNYGHVFVLGGDAGHGGAARLAARAALRVGAGVVTLGVPPAALAETSAQVNAVMVQSVADAAALQGLIAQHRYDALCLGPGMQITPGAAGVLAVALAQGPLVLDAGALRVLADAPQVFARLHTACVLTPHGGEFAALFPDLARTGGSRVDLARAAARRAGCVVLLKGADTVIADPSGRCDVHGAVYARSAPWLATAGAGDVLAGLITGLLARGFTPFLAATTGAYLHTSAALAFGPGLIAEDLPEMVPKVLRDLGL